MPSPKYCGARSRCWSDAAGGGIGDEDLGLAFEAGAFVEEAVEVEEAFGVGGGGVGEGGDDFVAVDGGLRLGRGGGRGEQGEGEEQGAAHEGEDIAGRQWVGDRG